MKKRFLVIPLFVGVVLLNHAMRDDDYQVELLSLEQKFKTLAEQPQVENLQEQYDRLVARELGLGERFGARRQVGIQDLVYRILTNIEKYKGDIVSALDIQKAKEESMEEMEEPELEDWIKIESRRQKFVEWLKRLNESSDKVDYAEQELFARRMAEAYELLWALRKFRYSWIEDSLKYLDETLRDFKNFLKSDEERLNFEKRFFNRLYLEVLDSWPKEKKYSSLYFQRIDDARKFLLMLKALHIPWVKDAFRDLLEKEKEFTGETAEEYMEFLEKQLEKI